MVRVRVFYLPTKVKCKTPYILYPKTWYPPYISCWEIWEPIAFLVPTQIWALD